MNTELAYLRQRLANVLQELEDFNRISATIIRTLQAEKDELEKKIAVNETITMMKDKLE